MLAILMECLDQQKGKISWKTTNPSQHMPPSNRFHDLVDAAGVASRILWRCVLVVGLRWYFCAPKISHEVPQKSPISNWLTFSSASFLAFIKYLESVHL